MFTMAYKTSFADWLENELVKREISQAELARRAGVTRSAINGVLTGYRGIGVEMCNGIAKALGIPPDEVFRAAGFLPATQADAWLEKQNYKLSLITDPTLRETAERLINSLAEQEEAAAKSTLKHKRVPK